MECRKELEDLILEVYENLHSDGVNILLPDDIARKIHGMVHLHRACSKNGDVSEDGSLIACGPGCSHDPKDENQEDGEVPSIAAEEILRVQQMIEEHMAKIDMEVTPIVEQAIAVATHVEVEPQDIEDDTRDVLETIPESPVVSESPVINWEVKLPNVETASLSSMDDDLKEIQFLNNQFDEMFQFMQKEFPDMQNPARYSPGLDATDVESCDGSIMDEAGRDLSPPSSPLLKPIEAMHHVKAVFPTTRIVKPVVKKLEAPTSTKKSQLPTPLKKSQLPTPSKASQLPTPLKNSVTKTAPPSKTTRSLLRPPASVPKPTTTAIPTRTRKFSNASDGSDIITTVSKQESKQDLASKRREEKEKREILAREEAKKMREHRRALVESKAEADRAARAAKAEMVRRRREEREKRILSTK
ncbi:hypothetical protein AeMF1_010584 [Aphanomyces euteiches]|nr:hypothetical protein AeMF1_010584 [Aphanomyces euteiches]KAH9193235.1 hypothetical protein AeNC1_004797 [Aphanomyces euteiches]